MRVQFSKLPLKITFIGAMLMLLSACGCSTVHHNRLAYRCDLDLSTASAKLEKAKQDSIQRPESLDTATLLLSSAKVQQQGERYPTCINKTARAMYYISQSQQI